MNLSIIYVYVTVPDKLTASQIAEKLIEKRLAACVNIGPVNSVYRWQDKICREDEVVLVIKTTQNAWDRVQEEILALHPADCPAIAAFSVSTGYVPFLQWIEQETIKP